MIPGDIPDLTKPQQGCIFAPLCQRAMDACRTETPPRVERRPGNVARCHLLEGAMHDPAWPPPQDVLTVAQGVDSAKPAVTRRDAHLLGVSGLNVKFQTIAALREKLKGITNRHVDAVLDVSLSVRPVKPWGWWAKAAGARRRWGARS